MSRVHKLLGGAIFALLVLALSEDHSALPTLLAVTVAAVAISRLRAVPRLAAAYVPRSTQRARRAYAAAPLQLTSAPVADGHVRSRAPGQARPRA